MPDLPTDSVEVERIVRGSLATLFSGIDGLPHVLEHATYVESEADYTRQFGYLHPATKRTEFRLLEVVFADFKDTDAGCEDNPVYNLNYSLTLIVSFVGKRSDDSSSTDDFARFMLTMRRRVLDLDHRHLGGYEQLRLQNLEPRGSSFGPDDTLNLKMAHVAAFNLSVEVTPS